MKVNHFIGGVLLVAGTTIGVGMLALPVVTSFMGFFPSLILFIVCWLVMLLTAVFFVDVNCSMQGEVNLITMAGKTLGAFGKSLSWFVYLLLLYSLLAAYISASSPLFEQAWLHVTGDQIPEWLAPFLLPLIFGVFIYLGTIGVDLVNRMLMIGLVASYCLLVFFVPPHIEITLLEHLDWPPLLFALPIVITGFGYHIIIPSLTTYLHHDRKHLLMTIVAGSLVALVVNVLWQLLVLGVVPIGGSNGLAKAFVDSSSATLPLAKVVKNPLIGVGAYFFSFFAIITSFLGISLSLSDFLTDGLNIKKTVEGRIIATLLTFIPPVVFVYTYAKGFIMTLEYAGAFVAILLIFLPAAMAWTLDTPRFYKSLKGKALLLFTMLFSILVVVVNIMVQMGTFQHIIDKYTKNV